MVCCWGGDESVDGEGDDGEGDDGDGDGGEGDGGEGDNGEGDDGKGNGGRPVFTNPLCIWLFNTSRGQIVSHAAFAHTAPVRNGDENPLPSLDRYFVRSM